jgi:hypothetical protein
MQHDKRRSSFRGDSEFGGRLPETLVAAGATLRLKGMVGGDLVVEKGPV